MTARQITESHSAPKRVGEGQAVRADVGALPVTRALQASTMIPAAKAADIRGPIMRATNS
jgi:hypothetical protein